MYPYTMLSSLNGPKAYPNNVPIVVTRDMNETT